MKKKTVIALATLLACGQGVWAQTTSFTVTAGVEEGTEEKPFLIENIADLNVLAADVNSGTDYKDTYFKLTADLDYSGVDLSDTDEDGVADSNFTPIGYGDESDGKSFKGVFDGNGHYIKGITVNTPSAMGVALFGYIYNPAEIRNLTLKDCSFTGKFEVGAIAGSSYGSATNSKFGIYGCTVESTVKVTAVSATIEGDNYPGTYAGGIIGYCGSLTVSGCTSAAEVKGDESVGGIAGHIKGSTLGGVIEDCFFTGSVQGGSEATEVGNIVGGRGPMDDEEGTDGTLKLTLIDTDGDADINNAARLGYYKDVANVDITISGRTLQTGGWNTFCVPFNLDTPTGWTVKTLTASSFNSGTGELTLTFADAASIEAGKPYLVKVDADVANPTFDGVTISNTTTTTETTAVDFIPVMNPTNLTGGDKTVLFVSGGNTLTYPSGDGNIKGFRAYFQLKGESVSLARAFRMSFDDNVTGIVTVLSDEPTTSSGIYTLDGRRLQGQPTGKGMYIVNGKKTIIK